MQVTILRFSAIGDVALCVPVIKKFTEIYPEVKVTIVSRKMFQSLFSSLGVNFIEADFNGTHKGLKGLLRLYQQIYKGRPDKIIDLHGVLRTHILQSLFALRKIPFFKIDKGRADKKLLTQKVGKVREQQKHSTLRYADVFAKAGFPFDFDPASPPPVNYDSPEAEKLWKELKIRKPCIGIAPLAGFTGKTWPIKKTRELVKNLAEQNFQIIIFGGPADMEYLEMLKSSNREVINLAGKLNFAGEIAFMKKMQLMISMDSSNMHLATLAGIPVVSVWGATHYFAGFGALGRNNDFIAEVSPSDLSCRPCSVFGNIPCYRGDYACLHYLSVNHVLEKAQKALNQTPY